VVDLAVAIGVGRGGGKGLAPLDFEILSKKVVFIFFSGKKQISPLCAPL